jgi:hypothetical protein
LHDLSDTNGYEAPGSSGPGSERGKLLPRQEEFCRRYAAQPVATRAAVLAGYAEESAANQGYRLLKNEIVLQRIAELRAREGIVYVLETGTMHDKLNAVYSDAIAGGNFRAAVAALALQARIGGLLPLRAALPAPRDDEKSQGPGRKKTRKARK